MKNEIAYSLNTLNLLPKTWDIGGWAKLAQKHNSPEDVINLQEDDTLPSSRKEFKDAVSAHEGELKDTVAAKSIYLDADKVITSREGGEIYDAWIMACEEHFFPAYVPTVSVPVKKFLLNNFRFKYAKDGSPIVYCRDRDQ